jgi:RNA polymerase sigma factor (sigma-70 family)
LRGATPLLRLAPDERLIALTRRGQPAAFEAIVARYQARLLAFCRHMLGCREDAEDVLQEVFAAAFNAVLADDRPINVRPWLYRIARNRCLNHLRRQTAVGVDSMDVHYAEGGISTVEKVANREDFRLLMEDVTRLPETQRSALLLREIDALSYEQIAEAMETTVPAVKSLLVRARVGLAEAAEARRLTCEEARLELGEVAEGLTRLTPPVRRHVKQCERCRAFRTQLRANNRALAAMLPVGPLLVIKKLVLTKLGLSAGGASATAGSGGAAGAAGLALSAGTGTGGALTAGAIATKAAATLAAAALVTAGAVEVPRVVHSPPRHARRTAAAELTREGPPRVVAQVAQPISSDVPARAASTKKARHHARKHAVKQPAQVTPTTATTTAAPAPAPPPPPPTQPTSEQISGTTVLPAPASATTTTPQSESAPPPAETGATGPSGSTGATAPSSGATGATGPTG